MPSLFTSTSTAPNFASASFTMRAISAGFDMSAPSWSTVTPCSAAMAARSFSIAAAGAGAPVVLEPWDAFWGDRYAQVTDPYGHSWSSAHTLDKAPADRKSVV